MIRIIKPELVVRTCFDPMRRSGAVAAVCKEHLLASVHRDKDPSDAPIRRVPGNHRFAGLFSRQHQTFFGAFSLLALMSHLGPSPTASRTAAERTTTISTCAP